MFRSFLGALLFSLTLSGGAIAQTCTIPNSLTNGTNADATQVMANFNALLTCVNSSAAPGALRSYLSGLTLSTTGGSANFAVAVGVATSDDTTMSMKLTASIAKTTGAWAVGSGNGSLDAGTIANSTWYHVYLIERTDTGVVDVLASLSASSPTLPTSYSVKRRIGSMKTDGSGNWLPFQQFGEIFVWNAAFYEGALTVGTSRLTQTLTGVPPGVQVVAKLTGDMNNTTAGGTKLWIGPLSVIDAAPSSTTSPGLVALVYPSASTLWNFPPIDVLTSTSAQIGLRATNTGTTVDVITTGYTDYRGKNN